MKVDSQYHTEWKKNDYISSEILKRQEFSFSPPLLNTTLEVLARAIKQEKEYRTSNL
jgi:hypothetical protein